MQKMIMHEPITESRDAELAMDGEVLLRPVYHSKYFIEAQRERKDFYGRLVLFSDDKGGRMKQNKTFLSKVSRTVSNALNLPLIRYSTGFAAAIFAGYIIGASSDPVSSSIPSKSKENPIDYSSDTHEIKKDYSRIYGTNISIDRFPTSRELPLSPR